MFRQGLGSRAPDFRLHPARSQNPAKYMVGPCKMPVMEAFGARAKDQGTKVYGLKFDKLELSTVLLWF